MNAKKAVLLWGYGGPQDPREVEPFIREALHGIPVTPERLTEVRRRYDLFKGVSPYVPIVLRQTQALKNWFTENGFGDPEVCAAFRYSKPRLPEVFAELKRKGIREAVVFALTPFFGASLLKRWSLALEEAERSTPGSPVSVRLAESVCADADFIGLQSEKILSFFRGGHQKSETRVLFSAHSLPESGYADYARDFQDCARRIANVAGLEEWTCVYQSRSGTPATPWLGPDPVSVIRETDPEKFRSILSVPVGFFCDNVEILYDIDVEARAAATEKGISFFRTNLMNDEPAFIALCGRHLSKRLGEKVS